MKKKKFFAIGIPVLAVLLCAVIVVGIWHVMGQKDEKFRSDPVHYGSHGPCTAASKGLPTGKICGNPECSRQE